MRINEVTGEVIGAAVEVHRTLGPGLLESVYEECLCRELQLRGLPFARQVTLPVLYKGTRLDCGYRLDLLVARAVVVEVKAIEMLRELHSAQLLTYLKMGQWQVGLLINFNVPVLRDGIRRQVLNLREEFSASSAPSAPLRSKGLRGEQ
jgi:GxxExxY protein